MGAFFRTLGGFFDSDNRRLEAQWLLAIVATMVGIGMTIYQSAWLRGQERIPFNFREFGEGVLFIIGGGGGATALVGLGRKQQGQGDAAQTIADKIPPVTGEGAENGIH